jgi:hypothetical protein
VRSGEIVYATPHDDEALFGRPAWLADGGAFLFATNSGREFAEIARYDLRRRSWRYVHEVASEAPAKVPDVEAS